MLANTRIYTFYCTKLYQNILVLSMQKNGKIHIIEKKKEKKLAQAIKNVNNKQSASRILVFIIYIYIYCESEYKCARLDCSKYFTSTHNRCHYILYKFVF